jgi:hypothetical protein
MRLRGPDGRSDDKERFAVVICVDRDPLTRYRGTQANIRLIIMPEILSFDYDRIRFLSELLSRRRSVMATSGFPLRVPMKSKELSSSSLPGILIAA